MNNLLEVKNLTVKFFLEEGIVHVLNNVSFDVEKGKVVSIIGESGSGKTVSCLSVMRLLPEPQGKIVSGEITFGGENLLKLSGTEMRKIRGDKISMIFQDPMTSLNPFLKIGFQLEEVLNVHQGLNRETSRKNVLGMMKLVGIPNPSERINNYPHQFSGGMKQRIMIAIAISCNPAFLIADEPTTALDVTLQLQILNLMLSLKNTLDMGILFISHDLRVVHDISD